MPYPEPKDDAATRVGKGNRRTDTKPEVRVRSELHRRGLRFRKDFPIQVEGRKVRPDIVFTRARVAVFVDGCFWHGCPEHQHIPNSNRDYWVPKLRRNIDRDRDVDRLLERADWVVLRAWEHEVPEVVASAVAAAVRSRSRPTVEAQGHFVAAPPAV